MFIFADNLYIFVWKHHGYLGNKVLLSILATVQKVVAYSYRQACANFLDPDQMLQGLQSSPLNQQYFQTYQQVVKCTCSNFTSDKEF